MYFIPNGTMTRPQLPLHIKNFVLRHCSEEPTTEEIDALYGDGALPVQASCLQRKGQGFHPCVTHVLCGRSSRRDAREIRGECTGVVFRLIDDALSQVEFVYTVHLAMYSHLVQLKWHGGPGECEVRGMLDAAGLLRKPSNIALTRTPRSSEMRSACVRLGKHLGVSLPYKNGYWQDETRQREYAVYLGTWSALPVGEVTLGDIVYEIANKESGPCLIPDEDLANGCASSDRDVSALAFLLLGASLQPKRRLAARRQAKGGRAVPATLRESPKEDSPLVSA